MHCVRRTHVIIQKMQLLVALLLCSLTAAAPLVSVGTTTTARLAFSSSSLLNTIPQTAKSSTPKSTLILSSTGSIAPSVKSVTTILKSGSTTISTLLDSNAARSSAKTMTSIISTSTFGTKFNSTSAPTYSSTQRSSGNLPFPALNSKMLTPTSSTFHSSNTTKSTFSTSTPKTSTFYASTLNTLDPEIKFSSSTTAASKLSTVKTSTLNLVGTSTTISSSRLRTSEEFSSSKLLTSSPILTTKTGEPLTTRNDAENSYIISSELRMREPFQTNTNVQDPNTRALTSPTQRVISRLNSKIKTGQKVPVEDNYPTNSPSFYIDTISKVYDGSVDRNVSLFTTIFPPVKEPAVKGPREDLSMTSQNDGTSNDAPLKTTTTPAFHPADPPFAQLEFQVLNSTPEKSSLKSNFPSRSSLLDFSTTPSYRIRSTSTAQSEATTVTKSKQQQYPIMAISLFLKTERMNAMRSTYETPTTTSKFISSTSAPVFLKSSEDYGTDANIDSESLVELTNLEDVNKSLTTWNETSNHFSSSNKTVDSLAASISPTKVSNENETNFINRLNDTSLANDDTNLTQVSALQIKTTNVKSSPFPETVVSSPEPIETSSVQMKNTRNPTTTQNINGHTFSGMDPNRVFLELKPWNPFFDFSDTTQTTELNSDFVTNSQTSSMGAKFVDTNVSLQSDQESISTTDEKGGNFNISPASFFQPLSEKDGEINGEVTKESNAFLSKTVLPVIDVAKPIDAQETSTSLSYKGDKVTVVTKAKSPEELTDFQTEISPNSWEKETISTQSGETTASSTLEIFDFEISANDHEITSSKLDNALYAVKSTPGRIPEKNTESYNTIQIIEPPAIKTTINPLNYSPDEIKTDLRQTFSSTYLAHSSSTTAKPTTSAINSTTTNTTNRSTTSSTNRITNRSTTSPTTRTTTSITNRSTTRSTNSITNRSTTSSTNSITNRSKSSSTNNITNRSITSTTNSTTTRTKTSTTNTSSSSSILISTKPTTQFDTSRDFKTTNLQGEDGSTEPTTDFFYDASKGLRLTGTCLLISLCSILLIVSVIA